MTASDHSEITVNYELGRENLYQVTVLLQLRKPLFCVWLTVIVSFSVGLYSASGETYTLLLAVPLVAFILLLVPYLGVRKIRKDPNVCAPVSVTFSESGIYTKAKHANSTIEWTMIQKAHERGRYIFVHLSRWNFWMIPKQQLTPCEIASLRGILRHHLKSNARVAG